MHVHLFLAYQSIFYGKWLKKKNAKLFYCLTLDWVLLGQTVTRKLLNFLKKRSDDLWGNGHIFTSSSDFFVLFIMNKMIQENQCLQKNKRWVYIQYMLIRVIRSLTRLAWGLGWLCLEKACRWGSRCNRSTGTSSGPPCGSLGRGHDPSVQKESLRGTCRLCRLRLLKVSLEVQTKRSVSSLRPKASG